MISAVNSGFSMLAPGKLVAGKAFMISAENSGFSMLAPGKLAAGKTHDLSRELWILDAGFRQAGCQEGFCSQQRTLDSRCFLPAGWSPGRLMISAENSGFSMPRRLLQRRC